MSKASTVSELGEFGLIDAISKRLSVDGATGVHVGIGDDAAVIQTVGDRVVATTDLLTEGVHFRTDWSTAHDIGVKAAAQNLADVFAMGGTPTALLVGLCIPGATRVDWVLGLADGLRDEAQRAGASVVGGDIIRGETITISVTALGHMGGRAAIKRAGARPGNIIAYTGKLGWSAAGLMLLQRGFRSPRGLITAHCAPQPDYDRAREAEVATAMIDISDGLVNDLAHIAQASQVSLLIDSSTIDVSGELADAASAFNTEALPWVLGGGEDHAFVATFTDALAVPNDWVIIGRVQEGPAAVFVDGRMATPQGWDHFAPGNTP